MLQHTSGGYARQLTRRQREALPHLLAPGSVSEKAKNAGVARCTLYRWLQDFNFRRTLEQACEDAMDIAHSQIQLASNQAVSVLFRALDDERPHIRLRAAEYIVKLGHDARFGQQLEEKLNLVEEAMCLKEEIQSPYA